MADPGLRVSPDLILPPDAVTKTFAFVAMVGAGKSNGGVVLAEEFHAAGLPFVVIDPKGDWYGMRSSGDGTGPGLPIPIFGGLHGDLPLLPEMGRLIADLIVDHNLTCILDVSEFASRAAQMRFLADFGEQLYRRHGKTPAPRHLILEEADEYLPQVVRADEARCVGVWTRIVKRGRQRGLGISILTQRCASVNKDGLSQCGTLVALRTIGAHDRKAILDWISYHDSPRDIVDSLPALLDGEACVISPQWLVSHGQPAVQRIRFRRRWTFDSGATPAFDQARPPATLADIDLGALKGRMEAVAEKAAQDDPAALRRRIADLQRQLTAGAGAAGRVTALEAEVESLRAELAAALARPAEQVTVPVLAPDAAAGLERAVASMQALAEVVGGHAGSLEAALLRAQGMPPAAPPPPARTPALPPRPAPPALVPSPARPAPPAAANGSPAQPDAPGDGDRRPAVKAGARNMLEQLARCHPMKLTRSQLAAMARIKGSGSTFTAYLSSLRLNGYVTTDGNLVLITPEGLTAAGAAADTPPLSPEEIRDTWRGLLKAGARAMLDDLLEHYPEPVTRADLAVRAGINPVGSTLTAYLSTLRTNGLITETAEGIRAADVFFLAGAGA